MATKLCIIWSFCEQTMAQKVTFNPWDLKKKNNNTWRHMINKKPFPGESRKESIFPHCTIDFSSLVSLSWAMGKSSYKQASDVVSSKGRPLHSWQEGGLSDYSLVLGTRGGCGYRENMLMDYLCKPVGQQTALRQVFTLNWSSWLSPKTKLTIRIIIIVSYDIADILCQALHLLLSNRTSPS